ncbi:hypothetical protein V7S43_012978 [Phytophthora oleae]|uniref:Ankyrin repeat-containing domain n=1 Tax=Phytophthora oleae TaxID=2107226 RepID=A0ABD3F5Q4_9STRA
MRRIARNGNFRLHANREEGCTSDAMDWAAGIGCLSVVKWLHVHTTEGCTTKAMNWAAGNGFLNVVKWLHVHRTEGCTSAAMDSAARNGHLTVIEWLHSHRSEGCSDKAIGHALRRDHFHVVLFLHQCKIEVQLLTYLRLRLSREVYQWLLANYADDIRDYRILVSKLDTQWVTLVRPRAD